MWKLIVRTTNSVVTTNYYQDREYVTDEELKELINQRDILNEKYEMVRIKEDMEEQYKEQIRELQQQIKQPLISHTSSEYINKLISDLISQVSDDMNLRFMRDDPVYSKYFAMWESGVALDDVAAFCRQEGNDEQVVRGPAIILSYKDDILQRLQAKGVIPAVIPAGSQGAAGAASAAGAAAPQPKNDPNNPRNNPAYAKWFKLLDMHIPKEHLIIKMEQEGVDPSILDYESPGGAQPSAAEDASADSWRPASSAASSAASRAKPKATPIITEKKAELRRRQLHIVPENRMKNLYWDCIDNSAIEGSVWEKMHATVEKEIDYHELETLFAAKENTFLLSQSKQEAAKSTEQEEHVQLIRDEKRLRNVGMAIVRLKPTIDEIHDAILEVDDAILDDDMVRILVSNAPTQEEIEIVKGYDGDLDVLDEVDRFFKVLSTIPFLNERLACIKTYHQFSSTIEDLRNQIDRYKVAIEKCVRSENLSHLMELILAIGNFLNGSSRVDWLIDRKEQSARLLRLFAILSAETARYQVSRQQDDVTGVAFFFRSSCVVSSTRSWSRMTTSRFSR